MRDAAVGCLDFSCKLNDTWPKIYCAVIDYFGEGYMPYYATKRAQEPILLCFGIRPERINLWLVNDSAEDIRVRLHLHYSTLWKTDTQREGFGKNSDEVRENF